MTVKPILFNTEMVRALLDGRKSVTRRVVKFRPGWNPTWTGYEPDGLVLYGSNNLPAAKAPYRPGDILYVRETWCDPSDTGYPFLYKADMPMHWDAEDTEIGVPVDLKAEDYTWHPSIHMPKEAARLFLMVTGVRVERLHDMQPYGIAFEGFRRQRDFIALWDSTIKKADLPIYGWTANPWVWVIEFERCERPCETNSAPADEG